MTSRTVLVADAGSAVGRATALAFREDGWTVYAAARDEAAVADLAEHGVETDALDVTDDTDVRRVVKRVAAEQDRLDCLAFDPRGGGFGPVATLPPGELRGQFDETALAFHRLVSRAAPHLRARAGAVVAVSSVFGRLAAPGTGGFGAGRAAMATIADALRAETVGELSVTLVEPVLVDDGTREAAAGATADPETGESEAKEETVPAEEESASEEVDSCRWASANGGAADDYAWVHSTLSDVATVSEGGLLGATPGEVAAGVVDAASVSEPPPRYPVGRAASLLLYGRYLPVRWRTAAFSLLRRVA